MKPHDLRFALFAAGVLLFLSTHARAQTVRFRACLDGPQEGLMVNGTGTAIVTLDTATGAVSVDGSYSGLVGIQTDVHIHGPAPIGVNAGIIITLTGTGGMAGNFSGAGVLSQAEVQDMLAGLHYLNVHSSVHMPGEIRGQIVQLENVDCPAELPSDPVLADTGGDPDFGPKIRSQVDRFNLQLDCSGAGAPGLYTIVLRLSKRAAPVFVGVGAIWGSGPKLMKCSGLHGQGIVQCAPDPGIVLPNDLSFVGIAYTAQGFCQDPSDPLGRTSNALVQVVGL